MKDILRFTRKEIVVILAFEENLINFSQESIKKI